MRSIKYQHADDVPLSEWRWPNFKPAEFVCKGTGTLVLVPSFLDRVQTLRSRYGKSMRITSGYRSPEYNMRVSSTGADGPHTTGRAVDVLVQGTEAYQLLKLALDLGFTGIGVQQKGATRFLHLDDLETPPRPNIWSY